MRIGAFAFSALCLATSPAFAQPATPADDVRKGHDLAALVCANCHVAAADQRFTPVLNPPAPSFDSIAQRPGTTAESLEKFMTTTHRGLDNPGGMPNPYLMDYQVKQLVAYILSLRK
jgi:mono/diheme cytochrome c family protein